MRNGDGEAFAAAEIGRMSQNHVSVVCAARFSRRSVSGRISVCQSMTAPQLPLLRICSVAHKASDELFGRSHNKFRSFTCQARQAIRWGW